MVILRKYNTATAAGTHLRLPIPKAGSTDFATGSDWTPAAGDVKVSKDGGVQANIGTVPSFNNGAWEFQLTATELSCKQLEIMVVDAAVKAIVDQCILIETFGNASAMYQVDYTAAALDAAGVRTALGLASANLDTQLATIAGYIDTEVGAIKTKTDNLPASPAATTDVPTANEIADAVMTRASSNWEGSVPPKSLGAAVMKATHKVVDNSGAGTIDTYESDDATISFAQTRTTSSSADPITAQGGAS